MKHLSIFFLLIALLPASASAQSKNILSKNVPQRSDYSFRTQVCSSVGEDGEQVVDSIITYVTSKQGTFTLVSHTLPLDPERWTGFGNIVEDDINFDGIPDLMICLGPINAFGGFTYDGYVWNPKHHMFHKVEGFDVIMDPIFDKKTKTITGTYRVDNEFEVSTYKLKNNKAVLIKSAHYNVDETK